MKAWKTIAAVVPGPAVLFVGQWLDLFSRTHLSYPDWQEEADLIARGVGAFVAVVLCMLLKDKPTRWLKGLAWGGLPVTLLLLGACWWMWFRLGKGMPPADAMRQQDIWEGLYIIAAVFLVATISVAALSLREERPTGFWILVIVPVVALLAIGIYVVFAFFTDEALPVDQRGVPHRSEEQSPIVTNGGGVCLIVASWGRLPVV